MEHVPSVWLCCKYNIDVPRVIRPLLAHLPHLHNSYYSPLLSIKVGKHVNLRAHLNHWLMLVSFESGYFR